MNWIIVKEDTKIHMIPEKDVIIAVHLVKGSSPEYLVRTSLYNLVTKTAPILAESYEAALKMATQLQNPA